MKLIKIIKIAYIAYTVYAFFIIDVTSLKAMDILPAVFIMWFMYITFVIGYKSNSRKLTGGNIRGEDNKDSWILYKRKTTLFTISIFSVLASIFAARFYTGQTPISVFTGLMDTSRSLYAEYQLYVKVQNIASFTIYKIPFILMLFYTKLVLFYTSISLLLIKEKTKMFYKVCLGLVIGAHIYFGFARGTNYELFEIVVLFIFIILSKKTSRSISKFSFAKLASISIIVGLMIFLFYTRITSRGYMFDYMTNSDFIYNPQGLISIISTELVFVIILLYDYFGFGFYYFSYYIMEVWLTSIGNFVSGLIPYGYYLQRNEIISEIVRNNLVMRARWHPDIILAINNLGIFGTFILFFALGRCTRGVESKEGSAFVYLTQFIILIQMVSFPTGNFVFVSSATTLIVMILVGLWFWKMTINKKIKF
jgi:hypothetical protein